MESILQSDLVRVPVSIVEISNARLRYPLPVFCVVRTIDPHTEDHRLNDDDAVAVLGGYCLARNEIAEEECLNLV